MLLPLSFIYWPCKIDLSLSFHHPSIGRYRFSPGWKITKRDRDPRMAPVSYGLWQRCELVNITIMKQGVALGIRPNVQLCRPNRYMRYSPDKYETCYYIRRNCPVTERAQLPDGCACRYLPSTKFLQWLTIFAAVFLIIGLLLLYLKTITSPQNGSSRDNRSMSVNIHLFLLQIVLFSS